MPTHGSGCRWQDKGFSVYMTDVRKEPDKCRRCRFDKSRECKTCKDRNKFVDRGFIVMDKRKIE